MDRESRGRLTDQEPWPKWHTSRQVEIKLGSISVSRSLALMLIEIKFSRNWVDTRFLLFGHPTKVYTSWVTSIRCYSDLLANEIQDMLRLVSPFGQGLTPLLLQCWRSHSSLLFLSDLNISESLARDPQEDTLSSATLRCLKLISHEQYQLPAARIIFSVQCSF